METLANDAGPDSSIAPNTTTTVLAAPMDPAELAEFAQLRLDDFTGSYQLDTELDHDPLCDGVPGVTVEFPPVAETSTQLTSTRAHFADIAVYEDPEAATEAFDYLVSGTEECGSSVLTDDEDGSKLFIDAERFSPASIDGIDRLTGFMFSLTYETFGVSAETNIGLVGSMLFRVGSTDPAVVPQLSETILARAAGGDPDVTITSEGALGFLPGFNSSEYYSRPDGPAELRALGVFSPGAIAWLEAATDDRIDEVASSGCVAIQSVSVGSDTGADVEAFESAVLSVFTDADIAEYTPEDLGEVFGGAVGLYCPGALDILLQVSVAAEVGDA